MGFAQKFERLFHRLLPSPLAIALVLSLLTIGLAGFWGEHPPGSNPWWHTLMAWKNGLWHPPLLVFMVQMILILVLGHAVALAPAVDRFIQKIIGLSKNVATASAFACFFTLLVAFFNWGLGLIFGAILARKMGERFAKEGRSFNYALLGAAAYSGLMVWHGGISGSAPLKVAEEGHLSSLMPNHVPPDLLAQVPGRLSFDETVFSTMNLSLSLVLLLILPLVVFLLARRSPGRLHPSLEPSQPGELETGAAEGAEKLDRSNWVGSIIGVGILVWALLLAMIQSGWSFLTPNFINLILLGLAFFFHRSLAQFTKAIEKAIGGAAGIIIQFPLYFGVMGIMRETGMIEALSGFFAQIASAQSFPIFTFFSAAIVNVFVPSGGGQWAIQGPVLIQTSLELGTPLWKAVMALAYGDQLTNMIQPFWALPLLGITGLKARAILPYTLLFLLIGMLLFILALLLF